MNSYQYTSEIPIEPGWYFIDSIDEEPEIAEIIEDEFELFILCSASEVAYHLGEFAVEFPRLRYAGPIEFPSQI